jgi:D-alanine-D-alanine ligase
MKIVVLAGGLSEERDVSLSSGEQIAAALERKGHQALLIDLYQGNEENNFEAAYFKSRQHHDSSNYVIDEKEPDIAKLIQTSTNGQKLIGANVLDLCMDADLCFIALHGGIGENGKLQALFDIFGIRYSGSQYKGSLLAMDKDIAKQLMQTTNIPTPDWQVLEDNQEISINVPCVVKPIDNGSSIGVEIVENNEQLSNALDTAKKYNSKIMIEQKVTGREFSVGILGEQVLPVIEIIPKQGFYNYESKYQQGATTEITPAEISASLRNQLQELTVQVYKALGLSIYARVDYIVTEENEIYCIEANSLPGMTPTSLLPQEAAAAGISFADLCEKIVELSMERYENIV